MTYEEFLSRMQAKYLELTGCDADSASDIGIRLRVLAEQAALLYRQIEEIGCQAFPQTSTGTALERHAECRGLTRKTAQAATGALRFSRETAAQTDIPLEAGILCATRTEPQLQVETTEAAVIPAGETSVLVPARACTAGTAGNAAVGTVCLMISPASGCTAVTNPSPFSGGADEESDEQLRERLLRAYRNISNGANAAFYYDIAMQQETVSSAAVLPRARGRGTVDVVVYCTGQTAATVAALQAELGQSREVGVDVSVYAATEIAQNLTIQVAPEDGSAFETVAERCRQAAAALLNELDVGEALLPARLIARLLETDGVYNVQIASPAATVQPAEYAILRAGQITVERMAAA